MSNRKHIKVIIGAAAALVVAGGSYGILSATAGSGSASPGSSSITASSGFAGHFGSGSSSNARSGPEPGGTAGTVSSTSTSGFTLTTAGGQKVTIKDTSSTAYENGTSPSSASALTGGQPVLVLGTADSTTITAAQVILHPPASSSSTASQVIPFQGGTSHSTKEVGQIPSDYT